jgi:hypothetical protein
MDDRRCCPGPILGIYDFAVFHGLGHRSVRRVGIGLACLLPGIFISLAVIGWMISLKGAEFITHENLTGWPTSYFMKRYGQKWLANTGLALTGKAPLSALELLVTVAFWCGLSWILARHGHRTRVFWLGILILAILSAGSLFSSIVQDLVDALFFPPAIVFFVVLAIPVAVWLWRRQVSDRSLQVLMLFLLSTLIASRSLFGIKLYGYPIFYDGPVLLSFFAIMSWFLPPKRSGPAGQIRSLQTLPYLGALAAAVLAMGPTYAKVFLAAPLVTSRGTIFARADKVQAYQAVLDFINRHKDRGSSFLSVPEDMSLYFLADIDCPIRLYQFHPGTLEPGRMESELIQQIDAKKIHYVIWSNRKFDNYGAPIFGVDFDRALGGYLRAHYRPTTYIGFGRERVPAESKLARFIRTHFRERMQEEWRAVIWERVWQPKVLAKTTGNRPLSVSVANTSGGLRCLGRT